MQGHRCWRLPESAAVEPDTSTDLTIMTTTKGQVAEANRRIDSLTGLRGLAALVVLLHHVLISVPALLAPYRDHAPVDTTEPVAWAMVHTPLHLLWAGHEAVLVFFVLSGFVLTLPLTAPKRFSWLAYYPARLVRLYVPIWGSLLLAVAAFLAVRAASPAAADRWQDERGMDADIGGLARAAIIVRFAEPYNGPLWSLYWEILFSLLLPAFAFLALTPRASWQLKVALTLSSTIAGSMLQLTAPWLGNRLFYLSIFLIGMVMAAHLDRLRRIGERIYRGPNVGWHSLTILTTACTLLLSHWFIQAFSANQLLLSSALVLQVVGAALLVYAAMTDPGFKRFLNHRVMAGVGAISFSLYLVHYPMLAAVDYLSGGQLWALIAIGIPSSFAAAFAFFRLVEQPSHRLARQLFRHGDVRRIN